MSLVNTTARITLAALLVGAGFSLTLLLAARGTAAPAREKGPAVPAKAPAGPRFTKVTKTPEQWQKQLTELQYHVLREEGTERAFTGAYWNEHKKGTYVCAGCGLALFGSDTKFDSGTGWPSFWRPAFDNVVTEKRDSTLGMERIALECGRCGGHLGHVFDDGPRPTGLRYCINSASLQFQPAR
jgi:peptide-methionine (R)-S-oxide reductase